METHYAKGICDKVLTFSYHCGIILVVDLAR